MTNGDGVAREGLPAKGAPDFVRLPDGRELFVAVRGRKADGVPTVVFESGLAASRSWWALVQAAVAEHTRTLAYDRAGLGRSPPDSAKRTMERVAADLNGLLDAVGGEAFILVGHSAGGPMVRAAAAARPERIAGLVLVDPSDELCDAVFTPGFLTFERRAQAASSLLARLGFLGRLYRGQMAPLPQAAQAELRREGFTNAVMRTRAVELAALRADLDAHRGRSAGLPGIPVTVISAGRPDPGMGGDLRAAMTDAHRRRAAASAQGRHLVADGARHMILTEQPRIIVEEIVRLLNPRG